MLELHHLITQLTADIGRSIQGLLSYEGLIQQCNGFYNELRQDLKRTAPVFVPVSHAPIQPQSPDLDIALPIMPDATPIHPIFLGFPSPCEEEEPETEAPITQYEIFLAGALALTDLPSLTSEVPILLLIRLFLLHKHQ